MFNVTVVTYKCYRVVASGSYNTKPLHHSVLHQSLSVRLQSLDGDILGAEKNNGQALQLSNIIGFSYYLFSDPTKKKKILSHLGFSVHDYCHDLWLRGSVCTGSQYLRP